MKFNGALRIIIIFLRLKCCSQAVFEECTVTLTKREIQKLK